MTFLDISTPDFRNGLDQPRTGVRDSIAFYWEFGAQAAVVREPRREAVGVPLLIGNSETFGSVFEKEFRLTPVPSMSQLSLLQNMTTNYHFIRSF